MTDKTKSDSLNKNDNRVQINRDFATSRELLFHAFTDAAIIKQWWGPNDYTCPVYQVDLRVGGKYLGAMRGQNGKDIWSTGTFTEISKPERLVFTDSFSDADGNVVAASEYDMAGDWPLECIVSLTFSERQGKTALKLEHDGIPEAMVKDCTQGWNESLNKLEVLLKDSSATKSARVPPKSASTESTVAP